MQFTFDTILIVLKQPGIVPIKRSETLTIQEFVLLSNCLYNLVQNDRSTVF